MCTADNYSVHHFQSLYTFNQHILPHENVIDFQLCHHIHNLSTTQEGRLCIQVF